MINIKSIWEDDHILEITISAENEKFRGEADIYTSREEVRKLGELIKGFPSSIKDCRTYNSDCKIDFKGKTGSDFKLIFETVDGSGHIKVRATIIENIIYSNVPNKLNFSEFDIKVEASAIDEFSNQLIKLSQEPINSYNATLNSINRTNGST